MSPHCTGNFVTTINRWYIDTRPYVPQPHNPKSLHSLPLLSTLRRSDEEAVTRFIRPADRFMSLASALLKYTFIHRRAKIPWSEVQISRTPAPHRRPYWEPPEDWSTTDIYDDTDPIGGESCQIRGLEFNVSHQAGLVTIIGCSTPTPQLPPSIIPNSAPLSPTVLESLAQIDLADHPTCTAFDHPDLVRLGVDIACTNEDKRTPKDLTTQSKFDEWIEIFAEMFSDRERRHMRQMPIHVPVTEREEGEWGSDSSSSSSASSPTEGPGSGNTKFFQNHEAKIINMKLRRFYAYWSLKEAYIKMVGEGLLASWLRELEFLDVHAPPPPPLPKQDRRPSTALNYQPRNSINTHSIIESQGMPLPASADIYAHRKSPATFPSVPPVETPISSGAAAATTTTTDVYAKRKSVEGIPPPPAPSSNMHHRKSSIPAADMYARRKPSISSPTGGRPRKLSIPATSIITSHTHARNRSLDYLSPFPDSPSTPSLLEPSLPAPSSPNGGGDGHHPSPIETAKWTPPQQAERGMTTLLRGKRVEDVQIELVAYDQDFMIATAIRGVTERQISGGDGGTGWGEGSGWWLRLDIEQDIRPCAEGWCSCLE